MELTIILFSKCLVFSYVFSFHCYSYETVSGSSFRAPLSHVLMAGPGRHWTGPAPRDPGPESRAGAGRAYYHRRMASSEHQL